MYKYLSFPDEEIVSGMLYSTDLNQCDNRKSKWKIPKKQTRGLENARWREVTCERGFVPGHKIKTTGDGKGRILI